VGEDWSDDDVLLLRLRHVQAQWVHADGTRTVHLKRLLRPPGILDRVWPFETLKNRAQAGMDSVHKMPGGLLGLYRGIGPGSVSVFLRNGAAMIAMQFANRKITEWGLRD
jgi:hypothetical protein